MTAMPTCGKVPYRLQCGEQANREGTRNMNKDANLDLEEFDELRHELIIVANRMARNGFPVEAVEKMDDICDDLFDLRHFMPVRLAPVTGLFGVGGDAA